MNFLLEITPDQYNEAIITTEGLLETLGFGGMMLLLGMGAVFAVLLLLWGALALFNKFFGKQGTKSSVKKVEVAPSPVVEYVPAATADEEIVAVIAAAIAMAESETNGLKFRVVSFRRK